MCWQQKKIISVELSILRVTVRDEVRDREREREKERERNFYWKNLRK